MPRRNRNCGREPVNRDRLIDEAARFARELTLTELVWVSDDKYFPVPSGSLRGES